MIIQLHGNGSARLQNAQVEIQETYVRLVIQNAVVYLEDYGPLTNTDFATVWAKLGEKLQHYGET